MTKKHIELKYFSPKPDKPIIISPKNDSHWSNSLSGIFEWIHNGIDLQYEYRIQIFNIPSDILWKDSSGNILIKSSWEEGDGDNYATWYKETSLNNYKDIIEEAGDTYSFYEITNTGNESQLNISSFNFVDKDLNTSTGITEDGIYLWRIQTKGTLSRSWSNWSYDGFFRIDRNSPSIKNISSSTIYKTYPNINSISDLSSPNTYVLRSDGTKDRGITSKKGLYIYYDYSENSLVLKTSGINYNNNPNRYYGMISFYPDENIDNFDHSNNRILPHEIVDSMYTFSVNRNDNESVDWEGPSEDIDFYEEFSGTDRYWNQRLLLINKNRLIINNNENKYDFVPKFFPDFVDSVYDVFNGEGHGFPALSQSTNSFVTIFPYNTYEVSSNKKFKFPTEEGLGNIVDFETHSTDGKLIEMRYPAPFQDVFILFNRPSSGVPTKILAYGQYEFSDARTVYNNPLDAEGPFEIIKGFNIESNRQTKPNIFESDYFDVFEGNDIVSDEEYGSIQDRLSNYSFTDGDNEIISLPYSYFIFFNLYPKENKDVGIKIKLRDSKMKILENENTNIKLGSFEFYMYPDTDCILSTDIDYKKEILLDDINIGRSCISARDLKSYHYNYSVNDNGFNFLLNTKMNTESSSIEYTKLFPITNNNFSDNNIVFVNEDSYDIFDKNYIYDFGGFNTYKNDTLYRYNFSDEIDTYDIDSFPYYVWFIDEDIENILEKIYGEDNVPFGYGDGTSWHSYPLYDIKIIVVGNDGVEHEFYMSYFQRYTDVTLDGTPNYTSSNDHLYSILFRSKDLSIEAEDILDISSIDISYITIRKDYGQIEKINNTQPYYSLTYNVDDFEIPLHFTDKSFIEIRNKDGLNSVEIYRVKRVLSLSNSNYIQVNDKIFEEIQFYPYDWGKIEDYDLSVYDYNDLGNINGNYVHVLLYNSLAADSRKYNGSFRINIPQYDYIPYYYPQSISLAKNDGYLLNPITPYISSDSSDLWYSLDIDSSQSNNSEGVVNSNFITSSDFIRFDHSSINFGQLYPYFYDTVLWSSLNINNSKPKGIFNNNDTLIDSYYSATRGTGEYGYYGYSMFYNGFSRDGIIYNRKVNSLFSFYDINEDIDKTKLYIKDFSNLLLNKSYNLQFDGNIDALDLRDRNYNGVVDPNEIKLLNIDKYTYGISPYINNLGIDSKQNILNNASNFTWIYNVISDNTLKKALISYDQSSIGIFGENSASETDWIIKSGAGNSFSGSYLKYQDHTDSYYEYEKIIRTVSDYPEVFKSLILRDPLSRKQINNNEEIKILGDVFSIGNVFGYNYTGDNIRVFFDVDDTLSGVDQYRYFVQTISTEFVESNNLLYDESISPDNYSIKMQTINNYDTSIYTGDDSAYNNVYSYRNPKYVIDYHLENDNLSSKWHDITNKKDMVNDDGSGYGITRVYSDIPVSGIGYKAIHIQVQDKSGNISDTYTLYLNLLSSTYNKPSSEIVYSANMSFDNSEMFEINDYEINDENESYLYSKNYLSNDNNSHRTITIKNVLNDNLEKYNNVDNLLIGFSDNYGLHYNVFSKFSSYISWDISLPVSIPMKSFNLDNRYIEPDWYFDPNHIRHYSVDSISDIQTNINEDLLPGNSYTKPITIIGLMEESNSEYFDEIDTGLARSNPIARKINEFREEFIGKKLIIGSDLSNQYTILHIFKSNNILPVKRNDGTTIDGDGDTIAQPKVWIVIEDEYGVAALILSRKFQYYQNAEDISVPQSYINYSDEIKDNKRQEIFDDIKKLTGWRSDFSVNDFSYQTVNFGYPDKSILENNGLMEVVNSALGIDSFSEEGKEAPITTQYPKDDPVFYDKNNLKQRTLYIHPTLMADKNSPISTNEGWMARLYKIYPSDNFSWDNVNHHNLFGMEVVDKIIFGYKYYIDCDLTYKSIKNIKGESKRSIFIDFGYLYEVSEDVNGNDVLELVNKSKLDKTMSSISFDGFKYNIISQFGNVVESGYLKDVSNNGLSCILDDDPVYDNNDVDWQNNWESLTDSSTYKIRIFVDPIDSLDEDENIYKYGWWPKSNNIFMSPGNDPTGTDLSYSENRAEELTFASEISGAFYIRESGFYSFDIESDNGQSSFQIDFMRHQDSRRIKGLIYDVDSYRFTWVAGYVDESVNKQFYLRKGWHVGRVRYISSNDNSFKYLRLLYKKPENDEWHPFVASRNSNYTFMARGFRTIHGKIINEDNIEIPKLNKTSSDRFEENYYLRAVTGFNNIKNKSSLSLKDSSVWVSRMSNDSSEDNYNFGLSYQTYKGSNSRIYGSQIFEEAYAVYESNIFDGGKDLKFWKDLSWTPLEQENSSGMDVEFYIRTASSEKEILLEKWNNIGEDEDLILPAFTNPEGNNILQFSNKKNTLDTEEAIKRFIQFKMVLKSRIYNKAPVVDDVTIKYSKENSVNFFTTTFNLKSNILRAILSYNGDNNIDINGVALSDIQFGICTTEESDGKVSTNFDDYKQIPINEVFDLQSLGVQKNDKFRIGIRFVSSTSNVPVVDEFAAMWETENNGESYLDRTRDL